MKPHLISVAWSLCSAGIFPTGRAGLALLLLLAGFVAAAQPDRPVKADLIIRNGNIMTMDDQQVTASAVAVRDGKFVRVGTDKEVMVHQGPKTRMIDAGGRRIIPGLNDSHIHVIRGGRFYNLELRWDGVKSLRAGLDMIREQAHAPRRGNGCA